MNRSHGRFFGKLIDNIETQKGILDGYAEFYS